jgi:phage-related protein
VEDNYYLDASITVQETGDTIFLRGLTKVDAVIVVDCDAETITTNGNDGGIDISWNTVRRDWLNLPSTAQESTCTLQYDEVGVAAVDIDIDWEDRNTL